MKFSTASPTFYDGTAIVSSVLFRNFAIGTLLYYSYAVNKILRSISQLGIHFAMSLCGQAGVLHARRVLPFLATANRFTNTTFTFTVSLLLINNSPLFRWLATSNNLTYLSSGLTIVSDNQAITCCERSKPSQQAIIIASERNTSPLRFQQGHSIAFPTPHITSNNQKVTTTTITSSSATTSTTASKLTPVTFLHDCGAQFSVYPLSTCH